MAAFIKKLMEVFLFPVCVASLFCKDEWELTFRLGHMYLVLQKITIYHFPSRPSATQIKGVGKQGH
jgi:hypothetical protein